MKTVMSALWLRCSFANAAVYLLNWATLEMPAAGQKTVERVVKIGILLICLPVAALVSSNLPVTCPFKESFSLFSVQEHSFHQFQVLRHLEEKSISIIHFTRKSTV